MDCKETLPLLASYADQELALPQSTDIDKHLLGCLACRDAMAAQKALRAAVGSRATYFVAPRHLEGRIKAMLNLENERKTQPARRLWNRLGPWNWLNPAAALASAVALAWSVGLYMALPSADDLLAEEVVAGHVRSLMADHLADVASSDRHTVKPWFNGKLDFSPTVMDLTGQGFPRVGGRLDYLDRRPCAALVYRHARHPINVYIWRAADAKESPPRTLSRQGYHLAYWVAGGMVYWAVSDVDVPELLQLVAMLRTAARPPVDSPEPTAAS